MRRKSLKFLSFSFLPAAAAGLVLACFPASGFAESTVQESGGIVRDKSAHGIEYMMGGVGIGEREIMENSAQDYNVKLSFAEKAGVFLAGIGVSVEDQKGTRLIDLTTNGPWLYVKLPPGAYTVTATFNGEAKRIQRLNVRDTGRTTRLLRWDLAEEFPLYANMKTQQKTGQERQFRTEATRARKG